MECPEDIKDILKKDGRDWTKQEAKKVAALVKQGGRDKLKAIRKDLRK